ncbi:methionyl-tRNA formyltransferase [uncultured Desulfuromonas sp.]|uniref:methionyl-tRNA formyltransferase n=1 Tax=uncultured Desulfuromonas sp. TaxID=181013 RepID=UPI00374DD7E9
MQTIRVVFMGTPDFALETLHGLIESGVQMVGVYTQPDRPKGRGKKLAAPPVKDLALEHDIPVFQPQKLRDEEAVKQLRSLSPDLIVVVAYGQILPQAVLDIPKYGCINVHASLLPRHRGAAPINKAIVDGDPTTGVTTMMMDVGLDTGDMLVKKSLSIHPDETAGQLHDRLAPLGREAMDETLARLCAGTLSREKQDDSLSTYASMMKKEDGCIDWRKEARQIHNLVRGLDPWPGAYTLLDGQTLKLAKTRCVEGQGEPGQVLEACGETVIVACGQGALQLGALQLPGKKMLSAADFLRGRGLEKGNVLGR